MERGSAKSPLRHIQTLYALGTLGDLADAQLLELFSNRQGDAAEDAFAVLVERHGPTVLGVCRRMLPGSHDAEDAFQATFLVLARKAASLGPRVRLGGWLHGVAVRTAREARRRAARQRSKEKRLMEVPRVESAPNDDEEDLLPILDEELNRLPPRYRAALAACELEGKSRHDAAQQLGLPEGTLSTHLARGRKLLRERLLRRGVSLGVGPLAPLAWHASTAVLPERLVASTIQAALISLSRNGELGTIPAAVATLAERVLKMMLLTRLSLILAAVTSVGVALVSAAMLASIAPTDGPPPTPVAALAGPSDVPGRVVDKAGSVVAKAQVWAIGGTWDEPETAAVATTDGEGRFNLRGALDHKVANGRERFELFARAPDGRAGWAGSLWRNSADGKQIEVELNPASVVRGRLIDQAGRPIAGVAMTMFQFSMGGRRSTDCVNLSPEVAAFYHTTTGPDGSFTLHRIPRGAGVQVSIAAKAFGSPRVVWDTSQAVTITLDSRLGQIKGTLKPPDDRGLAHQLPLGLREAGTPENSASRPFEVLFIRQAIADKDGGFQFNDLPPGQYVVNSYFNQDGLIAVKPQTEIALAPGGVARVEIPLQRLPMISGRVVDARSGKGVAGIKLQSLLLNAQGNSNLFVSESTTDAEGRYSIAARTGKTLIEATEVPKTYLGPNYGEYPRLEVKASQPWPDLKLTPATGLEGIVVDTSGRPAAGAEVYLLAADRPRIRRQEPILAGPTGEFHFDQLDPQEPLSLWARSGDATTDGAVVVRPSEVNRKLALTIDPKFAVRIQGMVTDFKGTPIALAKATLRWERRYASGKGGWVGTVLESYATTENGRFVFRGLWPRLSYNIVVDARGHNKAEAPELTGKAGETHDVGKVVLINTSGYLDGQVVGSDGRPVSGATVFNLGDAQERLATATDQQGRFRLEGLLPGAKYAFIRKDGFRFTGAKTTDDAGGLTITLLKTNEPAPPWQPVATAGFAEQRAFVKQILIRLWERYGAHANDNGAFVCILDMTRIDPDLAMHWSAQFGHRYDSRIRPRIAEDLAETDAVGAMELLNQEHDRPSQFALQRLAVRFAATAPQKAMTFAAEAAVRAKALNQPDRTLALAQAGTVLVTLGRTEAGRKLIDEAAREAAQLGTESQASYYRGLVAQAVAPFDVERALALIEPIRNKNGENMEKDRYLAFIAGAIATRDTSRAVALADKAGGRAFYQELVKTEIAYKIGADRPDEAIKIIEGMRREPAGRWQAEAFGWLAVALAPRDRTRACALIDRALAILINNPDPFGRSASSGGEMASAAHVAACARRIGYPDMESVIMRVLATRPTDSRAMGDRASLIHSIAVAVIPLALLDPGAARTVLEQVEARGGLNPATLPLAREPWLTAWSLVDLKKARALVEAELTALEAAEKPELQRTSIFPMVRILAVPPEHREEAVSDGKFGASWRPGYKL